MFLTILTLSTVQHRFMSEKFTRRERKLLPYIGISLFILLILWIVLAPNRGLLSLYRANQEMEKLQAQNRQLQEENRDLQEEITRLQKDPAYLEEKARKDYGMLKENEVLYIFKDKKK
jgi:cell division protein FtsB